MTTTTEVTCPKCGNAMWDNRLTKRNPKAPDYKCKDQTCDGAVWPPKPGQRSPVSQPPAQQKVAHSAGPLISGMDDMPYAPSETGAPPNGASQGSTNGVNKLDALLHLYGTIESHVLATSPTKFAKAGVGASPESTAAQIATLFIAANDAGLAR